METINFSLSSLLERIEEVHGKITNPFHFKYPTDPRCRYTLRIEVGCEDGLSWNWDEANDAWTVKELIKMDVVSFRWDEYSPDSVLTVVVRK
jgi:hypothetical protein